MAKITKKEALDYHSSGRPGKIEVVPTKRYQSQHDLSLAYSPGVAEPCREIQNNPDDAYKYTAKGNLVAVISNGTAVLGLGDIGTLAGKPVMEGKGLLFKIFADIDVFDIEVDEKDPDKLVEIVKAISPTFGGINLEDIKAPECFHIEERLKNELSIPLMHDDQHGTAIISAAGLLNALEVLNKKVTDVKVVVNGAGASAVSCIKLYMALGVDRKNIVMVDSKGVLNKKRTDLNKIKQQFVTDRDVYTLAEALKDADVFLGLSVADVMSPEMLLSMAKNPIVFAMANPDPEISYDLAMATRNDIIFATGRSDHPNQINNVLGFPFIFRGALDVRATKINEEMKLAAVYALASLAKEPVPEEVNIAYHAHNLVFGPTYIIPKPMDPRLITTVAPAVAKAAMESGVAQKPIEDWEAYKDELTKRMGLGCALVRNMKARARLDPKRVVFAEADHYNMLKAAEIVKNDGVAIPILLGKEDLLRKMILDNELDLNGVEIIDPESEAMKETHEKFANLLYEHRKRKGITLQGARGRMNARTYFAPMMVNTGMADAMVSGITKSYPNYVKPALEIIGKRKGDALVSGMYIINTKEGPIFFADTTVNLNPSVEQLVEITMQTVRAVREFNIEPRVALLSYSNFGSTRASIPDKVGQAVSIMHKNYPDLIVDGDIQANFALNPDLLKNSFPFSKLAGGAANVLIFPYLTAGNIAYKLIQEMGKFEAIGPILNGMSKSVHVLQIGASVAEIVNMVTVAVIDAQSVERLNQ
ncbi:MAG: NADP-dependent malic enzyme [Bacteroidales bacterium]|nr:NADP-dependent malic enzyme [Bacteroidales bacterium]MCF8457747.1 NADP-dependent malic enzyme [Bacteroidales bacterium]